MENKIIRLYSSLYLINKEQLEISIKDVDNLVNKDSKILLKSAGRTIITAYDLLDKGEIVNAMVLCRIALENITIGLLIKDNKDIKEAFTDLDNYYKYKNKLSEYYKSDRKCEKPIDYLKPEYLRDKLSENAEEYFSRYNGEELKQELDNIYKFFSNYVHPSIIRNTIFSIQRDDKCVGYFKLLTRLNIHYMAYLYMNCINKINDKREDTDSLFSILGVITLATVALAKPYMDVINDSKKYNKYLYIERNKQHLNRKARRSKDELTTLKTIISVEGTSKEIENTLLSAIKQLGYNEKNEEYDIKILDIEKIIS